MLESIRQSIEKIASSTDKRSDSRSGAHSTYRVEEVENEESEESAFIVRRTMEVRIGARHAS